MATGGQPEMNVPGSAGPDDLSQIKCHPCQEDGDGKEAVGMCIDCQDYLCLECYKGHTVPRPSKHHRLLDKEQMLQGNIRAKPRDVCEEKCTVHPENVIRYFCKSHCQLGCRPCIIEKHNNCDDVLYIPRVSKKLGNNEEYSHIKSQLLAALDTFDKVFKNAETNYEQINESFAVAMQGIQDFRRRVDECLGQIEEAVVKKANELKSKVGQELAEMRNKYKSTHEELESSLTKITAFQDAGQTCNIYTEMMRTKRRIASLEGLIKEGEIDKTCRKGVIKFCPNKDILESLRRRDAFGRVALVLYTPALSGSEEVVNLSDSGSELTRRSNMGHIQEPSNPSPL